MGIGFVILFHLAALFILCVIIALIVGIATHLLSSKERRKRKIFLAIICPFIGLFSLYFFALFGSVFVSWYKNVDIGIGDVWYVPLSDHCQFTFVDLPEQAYIECDDQTIVSEVSEIAQVQNEIYAKTSNGSYFVVNLSKRQAQQLTQEDINAENGIQVFMKAIDFYTDRRDKIAGHWLIIVGISSLVISIVFILITRKIVLGKGN